MTVAQALQHRLTQQAAGGWAHKPGDWCGSVNRALGKGPASPEGDSRKGQVKGQVSSSAGHTEYSSLQISQSQELGT